MKQDSCRDRRRKTVNRKPVAKAAKPEQRNRKPMLPRTEGKEMDPEQMRKSLSRIIPF